MFVCAVGSPQSVAQTRSRRVSAYLLPSPRRCFSVIASGGPSRRFAPRRRASRFVWRDAEEAFPLFSLSSNVSRAELWWEKHTDIWHDVASAEALQEALRCPQYEICFVDWFATWCHGCRKTSPLLNELAADPNLNQRVRFIRACVDTMADFARREGVKALPYVSIYDSTGKKLLGFGAAASKSKSFRQNLQTVLDNPGKDFSLDPNNCAFALDRVSAEKQKSEMERAVEELKSFKLNLSQKLSPEHETPTFPPKLDLDETSSEEEDGVLSEKQAFLDVYGRDYGYRGLLNSMYDYELGQRLGAGQHYLDYTGSSVYTETQLKAVMKDFRENMFGNPHSENPSSALSRDRIEEVRRMVLDFFDADPREYQVVFTKSATAALKMIGETYPWTDNSTFRYLRENHNSVLGIREYVLKEGGQFQDYTEDDVEQWISTDTPTEPASVSADTPPNYHLFAFPAEDNFAGVKYPLSWIEAIQKKSTEADNWKVMLDAAAFVGTQPLSLRQFPADYVAISFYKMFGYPTGLGALILKVADIDILKKVFWAGGSVALATSHDNFHVLKCRPTERLEDGTVAFLDIISLKHGFEQIERVGGMRQIQKHVQCLTEWLYGRLSGLKHSNGKPLVKIFGKHDDPNRRDVQGGILNFELLGTNGKVLSYKQFEIDAADAGFHVRTGIECNPGAAYNYIGIQESEVESLAGLTEGCDDELEYIQVPRPRENSLFASVDSSELSQVPSTDGARLVKIPLGSVRVSLGYMSTFEDCLHFAEFLERKCKDQEL